MAIKEAIESLIHRKNLEGDEMKWVMREIMEGLATPAQIAAFLTALRIKGETVEEIAGAAQVMREKCIKIQPGNEVILDTCGTGGDSTNTVNISTISAFVAAGAGVVVAKHGNRSVSSRCGSADVLQELGVNIEVNHERVEQCIADIGIGFIYAPLFHPAMRYAITPRREIGIRTIFNILGPLTNPAEAKYQLLGVYSPDLTETLAEVLRRFESRRAMVVHGEGLDEITITGATRISELRDGKITTYFITPEEFGLKTAKLTALQGGDPSNNAKAMIDVLGGKESPVMDSVLLNAGAGIAIAGRARDIREGIEYARESIHSGRAMLKLKQLIQLTNRK